ncbi:MAG: class I SAM-dependent methyltransferase [Pseudomonadota bacterium]|nr:class I SAM-dependent methyltransferase [Pseudomonadota bacterium]
MGIDPHSLALLAHAADLGVRYERTLGIGRQAVYIDAPELDRFAAMRGLPSLAPESGSGPRYFESLLSSWFGAGTVDSVDASPYEAATFVHDMNEPWPSADPALGSYDAVIDFGCLEHVFDFPVAWRNCVAMLRDGGHVLHALPMNNLAGHGFYQFSPELFFNLYRPERGFELRGLWLAMKAEPRHWWQIDDPRSLGRRVTLCNAYETTLLVLAQKRGDRVFAAPQQSDYAEQIWRQPSADASRAASDLVVRGLPVRMLESAGLLPWARRVRERGRALRATAFAPLGTDYRRIVVADLLRPRRMP